MPGVLGPIWFYRHRTTLRPTLGAPPNPGPSCRGSGCQRRAVGTSTQAASLGLRGRAGVVAVHSTM